MRFLPLIFSNIALLYLNFISIKESKNIDENSIYFADNFFKYYYSIFSVLISKNGILSDKLSNKVKIAIKNMSNEDEFSNNLLAHNSKKIAEIFLILFIFLTITSITSNFYILLFAIFFIIIFDWYKDDLVLRKYQNYIQYIKSDLPDYLTRLSLLVNSGINLRTSIGIINKYDNGELSKLLKLVNSLVQNGMSEIDAYNFIMSKTDDISIRKFISSIVINLQKGSDDIEKNLLLMKRESDEIRRTNMVKRTQDANRKMLVPNLIIFTGILTMVMIPILINAL